MKKILGNPLQLVGAVAAFASIGSFILQLRTPGVTVHIIWGFVYLISFVLYAIGSVNQAARLRDSEATTRAIGRKLAERESIEGAALRLIKEFDTCQTDGDLRGFLDAILVFLEKYKDAYPHTYSVAKVTVYKTKSAPIPQAYDITGQRKYSEDLRETCKQVRGLLRGSVIAETSGPTAS
jgi:hypothetical protein